MADTNLSCGIVGLPNVGKSTLFNALTKQMKAEAANFPFCTIEPNVGIVEVHDPRLKVLSQLSKSQKLIYATTTFVDIAGLVEGASKGEGLGNQFLANIRETDLIIHVVRCFEDENVIHVKGEIDPISDIEVIEIELILADLQTVTNLIPKLEKKEKGQKEKTGIVDLLKRIEVHLNEGKPVRTFKRSEEENLLLKTTPLMTAKKQLFVANVAEDSLPSMTNQYVEKVDAYAKKHNAEMITICAKLEAELAGLSEEDSIAYLHELGLKETGLDRLIKTSFQELGLLTFLTTGEIETRAWTIPQGTKAPIAAGKIHSDIQKGFIRAEVVSYEDMVAYNGKVKAKEAGKVRMEGKDYIVKDGDVILFYHN
jgi:GTP-binding protein YchF